MDLIRSVAKRVLPAGVKTRVRLWPWRALDLQWQLRTGPTLKVRSKSEWLVYNDIFVDGEYDRPIGETLDAVQGREIEILDVGANLGFFTLRVVDLVGKRPEPRPRVRVTCVEGSPSNHAELTQRLGASGLSNGALRVVHGLAGAKSGAAVIYENDNLNGMNSVLLGAKSGGVSVPFVDIAAMYPGDAKIDLLKCDIEGSELSFIENNMDLFRRVQRAVFELHPGLCDVEKCRSLLREAGLARCEHLWDRHDTFTDYFVR